MTSQALWEACSETETPPTQFQICINKIDGTRLRTGRESGSCGCNCQRLPATVTPRKTAQARPDPSFRDCMRPGQSMVVTRGLQKMHLYHYPCLLHHGLHVQQSLDFVRIRKLCWLYRQAHEHKRVLTRLPLPITDITLYNASTRACLVITYR